MVQRALCPLAGPALADENQECPPIEGQMARAFRIRTLLLLGAALPLAVLVVLVVNLAMERREAMEEAGRVQSEVQGATVLLLADRAVVRELGASDNVATAFQAGINPAQVALGLGISLDDEMTGLRADVDASIDQLSVLGDQIEFVAMETVDNVLQSISGLEQLRADIDAGTATVDQVDAMWSGLSAELSEATEAQLEVLSRVENVANSAEIRGDVSATRAAAELGRGLQDEIFAMAQILVAEVAMLDDDVATDLLVSAAVVDDQIDHLGDELLPEHLGDLERIVSSDDFLLFEQTRDVVLAASFEGEGSLTPAAGVASINSGIAVMTMVGDLADEMIADAGRQAAHAELVADAALKRSISAAIAVAGLTLLTITLATRAIVRPLRRLEQRARRISDGDLDQDEVARGGVREVKVVNQAMDNMVHNLRVLERQADALSVGDVEAARLDEEPPGRLGASLRRSVERLTELTARLDHQARHDTLTGLPNRAATMAAMEGALARGQRQATDVALLFVDLDDFKWINDANGHAVGDAVLEETAARLRARCRAGDTVGRLGGDEFVVVMEGLSELAPAVASAERLIAALKEPYQVGGRSISCSASVGLSWSPRGTGRSAELLHNADLATLRAKALGRGRVELFDERLRVAARAGDSRCAETEAARALVPADRGSARPVGLGIRGSAEAAQ
jgi:diguanylate cyclase (GGDEF)-like protein